MQRHIDRADNTNRYFEIGLAVFAFLLSCGLGALVFYVLLTLSALSQQ